MFTRPKSGQLDTFAIFGIFDLESNLTYVALCSGLVMAFSINFACRRSRAPCWSNRRRRFFKKLFNIKPTDNRRFA